MELVFFLIYGVVGAALVFLVLLQHGKGSDVGAAFGSGASNAIFGPVGPGSMLARITAVLAATFFAMSLGLAWQAKQGLAPEALELEAGLAPETEEVDTALVLDSDAEMVDDAEAMADDMTDEMTDEMVDEVVDEIVDRMTEESSDEQDDSDAMEGGQP